MAILSVMPTVVRTLADITEWTTETLARGKTQNFAGDHSSPSLKDVEASILLYEAQE